MHNFAGHYFIYFKGQGLLHCLTGRHIPYLSPVPEMSLFKLTSIVSIAFHFKKSKIHVKLHFHFTNLIAFY